MTKMSIESSKFEAQEERSTTNQEIHTNTSDEKERRALQFSEIYKSPEWKELDSLDRAQLLLVAEGVKPGTIIGGNFTTFKKFVEEMRLEATLNTHPFYLRPVYKISRSEKLSEYYHDILSVPAGISTDEFHRINGKFLGYPPCCTKEYIKPEKNLPERKKFSPRKFISNVDFEVFQLIENSEIYPEELDYCPPSFTPCSARCENALKTLGIWKEVLDAADPEATQDLRYFNWRSEPYRRIHQEELSKIEVEEEKKYQLEMLRNGVGG